MCGIVGAFTCEQFSQTTLSFVEAVLHQQKNRGPDHQAVFKNHQVILGHNRLSIIDLESRANQPLQSACGRYVIIFNGEIYNYVELRAELIEQCNAQFKTTSDTEVILAAFQYWGIDCLERLEGMFAFAIYDQQLAECILARDRFGIKPLYYYQNNSELIFASTTHLFKQYFNLTINREYLQKGLLTWAYEDNSQLSPYENLNQLPAGHYLKFDIHSGALSEPIAYYRLKEKINEMVERDFADPETECQQLLILLKKSIFRHIRADVPIGCTVSSGLDSTSLYVLAQDYHSGITGFSIGSPEDQKSEGPLLEKFAKQNQFSVNYLSQKNINPIEAFSNTLQAQDAPFASLSIVAQHELYRSINKAGIRVSLGGQGADEIFLGYRKFIFNYAYSLYKKRDWFTAIAVMTSFLPSLVQEIPRFSNYLAGWRRLTKHQYSGQLPIASIQQKGFTIQAGSLQQRQILDVTNFSLPTLLRYEDRNSMAFSVESRLPYLDHNLVEYAIALPIKLKINKGYAKWILRKAMSDKLPKNIAFARYKRGFDVSSNVWLQQGLGDHIRSQWHSQHEKINQFFNAKIDYDFYTDKNLLKPIVMHEAIALSWLAEQL